MAAKSSKDISNNIKRLDGILQRQRQALKAMALDDPDFKATEVAIKKTISDINKNKADKVKAVENEKAVKANQELADAKENLAYAEAAGDTKEIKKAKDALNVATFKTKSKDADNDGIPDSIDADPNTPTKKPDSTKTPVYPDGTPVPSGTTGGKGGTAGGKGATGGTGAGKTKAASDLEAEALNVAAGQDFALPETLFKNIPSLNALLKRYVAEKWTPDKLRKAIRDDVWYKQNSAEIKARYVQYYNYQDLVASGRATGSSDYETQISKIEANLKKRAVQLGSAAANDPAAIRKAAENLYITNRSEDDSFITDFLAASIKPTAGMIGGRLTEGYSGQALTNYSLLVQAARDNGFQVSDIVPGGFNEQQVLQGIASGKIDINRVIADTRKLAAQGQPQYVRDLLSQGYNLNQQIDLNDPLLRSAITEKGDMNLYDFRKALRQDERWQYTGQAKADVSQAALGVLRDFGFQG